MKAECNKPNKEYFTGHKDCTAINSYLNALPEDSKDFQVVYQLRTMGEEFVDGKLTMDEVLVYNALCKSPAIKGLSDLSSSAEVFIHEMKCWSFYNTLRAIASGNELTPFQQRVKDEIEHPSWKGEANTFTQKLSRWWYTRWKHPLVFNEPPLAKVITFLWSVVRMQKIVKD